MTFLRTEFLQAGKVGWAKRSVPNTSLWTIGVLDNLAGASFFTLVTHQRQKILTEEINIARINDAFKIEMAKRPFIIEAFVLLPDHLHTIWKLPDGDHNYSTRWSAIKRYFSTGCVGVTHVLSESRRQKREKAVWQRRFWEHTIQDEEDWRKHLDYLHYNPVKHGYVASPKDWPYSSFHRRVEIGWYTAEWGTSEPVSIAGDDYE